MKSLALYIHIPFCIQKCHYCDFLSFEGINRPTQESYFEALRKEIADAAAQLPIQSTHDYEVSSIYFGGGTPSYPDASAIEKILNQVHDYFHVRIGAEITLEVNPGTVSLEKFQDYKRMGINRLSIGAQSMLNLDLQHLGRAHTVSQFFEAYRNARTAGFRNISVDVIMGLPGQKLPDYLNTLREIVECKPEHISSYSLTIEKGTPFYEIYGEGKEPVPDNIIGLTGLPLPDDEEECKMYDETGHFLRTAGYHRYEISNYAKNDDGRPDKYESRHNLVYWTRGDYLGLGLGASSMLENTRFSNTSDFSEYVQAKGDTKKLRRDINHLDLNAQVEEFMFLGLRMMKGVSVQRFEEVFGKPITEVYGPMIEALVDQGVLTMQNGYVMLTTRGIDVSNVVMSNFLFERDENGRAIAGNGLIPLEEKKTDNPLNLHPKGESTDRDKEKDSDAIGTEGSETADADKGKSDTEQSGCDHSEEAVAEPVKKKRKWPESKWVHGGDL